MSGQGKRKSTEKSEGGSKAAAVSIKRTAMSGRARAINSKVYAVEGGSTEVDVRGDVNVKIIEKGMTGDARAVYSKIQAAKDHRTSIRGVPVEDLDLGESDQVTLPAASAERGDASKGLERNADQLTFGNGKTVALLLSGSGKDSEIFRKDVELIKTLLASEKIGLSEHKLWSVCRKPDTKLTTKKQIKRAIEDLQAELEGSTDGNLIFYYSGHFTKEHQLVVDERDDRSLDYYEDKDLAEELKTIPARHMLLILDMCYSGRADVGAKHADGFPVKVEDKESSDIVPRLWELMMSGKGIQAKGAIRGKGDNPEKVVQWSSSSPDEPSYDLKSSVFTKAIIDVVNNNEVKKELEPGQTHATIRQLHRHVVKHVEAALQRYNKVQGPIIKPDYADEEYFKTFPCFAKVM